MSGIHGSSGESEPESKRLCMRSAPHERAEPAEGDSTAVSVIMPVFNASDWLDECLQAVLEQDFQGRMELSVYDDGSTDNSRELLERWRQRFEDRGFLMLISGHGSSSPRGVGFAKNQAVCQSSGRFLCFQDADDIMRPQRVRLQYEAAAANPNTIVGCKVCRVPEGSTERYTRWINSLSPEQLLTQDMTNGVLEENLQSLKLKEGIHYYHFN
ncbi:queuosine-tRNA galactosyltransferase [Garra rufa]|uniref:queuosine-tRNA galactosyltransferase n=1 Tax=Garra rufa TaxID=137080 RepID=UPI003CCE6675